MSDYTPSTEEVREAFASYEDIEFRIDVLNLWLRSTVGWLSMTGPAQERIADLLQQLENVKRQLHRVRTRRWKL